ncbi:MAG: exonuclease domain-containing protein [Rhodobacteraceae bacterium]|nr:exonuclease domain-containing protein [Paracoccaceae bacterium]MCY4139760.1 exonuclease domain-containing protein [Paracoccaceae bacterium]
METFAAIDFETSDHWRDSACSAGVALVENGRITETYRRLVRPPRKDFVFTCIHGLTWSDVRNSPTFPQMWPELRDSIDEEGFLVARNAPFDKGVLRA